MNRQGVILPIVLVSLMLLAGMVATFQFLSSSDYRQVSRLTRNLQSIAVADLAADEVYASIASISSAPGAPAKPAWVDPLLAELDTARGTTAGTTLDVKKKSDYSDKVPLARQAAAKSGLVDVRGVQVAMGPFEVRSSRYPIKAFYRDPAMNDTGTNPYAWDLRGPLSVEISIANAGGPLEFSQRFLRGQMLEIIDTTPPASEFALFSYMPPLSDDYALNDMQRGGAFTVSPTDKGRVFVRGPLLVLAEEPLTADLHKGGPLPPGESPSYPEKTKWTGWSMIPGPRTLQQPQRVASVSPISLFQSVVPGIKTDMEPVRPLNDESHSKLQTRAFTVLLTNVPVVGTYPFDVKPMNLDLGRLSFVLGDKIDTPTPVYQTIDTDQIAYYPPAAWVHGMLPQGKMSFVIKPAAVSMYAGANVKLNGDGVNKFVSGTAAPAEVDAILSEPVPAGGGQPDIGLIGVYGTAAFESYTLAMVTAWDSTRWIVQKAVDKLPDGGTFDLIAKAKKEWATSHVDDITRDALNSTGIDPALKVMFRRYKLLGSSSDWLANVPRDLTVSELSNIIQSKEAIIAPYGLFQHKDFFWKTGPVQDTFKQEQVDALQKPLVTNLTPNQICDKLFPPDTDAPPSDAGWQELEASVTIPERAKEARDWLRGDYQKMLVKLTAAKDAGTPEDALKQILETANLNGPKGLPPLAAASQKKRPKGAFDDFWGPGAPVFEEVTQLANAYEKGFFPPQYREWESIATRTYPDFDSYLANEKASDGVLELKGAVLIQKMDYPGAGGGGDIRYRGRGIIIALSETEAGSRLEAKVTPVAAAQANWLILAHRVKRELVVDGKKPPLKLGPIFDGTVYSDMGVTGTSGNTQVFGNLVTGLLNKEGVAGSPASGDGVTVNYRKELEQAAKGPRAPYWTVEQSGEVVSVEPTS